jgi:diguanylate cyclase (GGDEF)-like protein
MVAQAVSEPLPLGPHVELQSHIDTAWSLRHSDVNRALDMSRKNLQTSQALQYPQGIAHSLLTQSFCYFRLADYKKALDVGQEALALFEVQNDHIGKLRVLNTLGIVYAESGDLIGSLKTFLQVQKLSYTIHDLKAEADALNNLAIVYNYLGDHISSLESYVKSLDLARLIGSKQAEMKALVNIATLYLEQQKPSEALDYLQQSLKLKSEDDPHTYAIVLGNISRAHAALEDFEQALHYGLEGLERMEALEDPASASYVLDALGNIKMRLGHYDEAKIYFEKSLTIKREIGDPRGQAETHLLLAKLLEVQGAKDEATAMFHKALSISDEIGAPSEIYKSHQNLAQLYKNKGDFQNAFFHLEQYIQVKEKLSTDISTQRLQSLQVKFETEQTEKEKEIYRLQNVELARMNEELQRLSDTMAKQANEDPLTGLYNRRRLEQEFDKEISRVRRLNGSLSVMICDIDNFKQINDRFSHQVGDQVLIQVAKILKGSIRISDVVARFGGEEFVGLFPETPLKEAVSVCERLREGIAEFSWQDVHPDLKVTISIGVCADTSLKDVYAMIDQADAKLYEAKRSGKNIVCY